MRSHRESADARAPGSPTRGLRAVPALLVAVALVLATLFGAATPSSGDPGDPDLLDVSPDPVEFGSVQVGKWSTAVTLELAELGYPAEGIDISDTTWPAGVRVASDTCHGLVVAPTGCTIDIQVKPDTQGPSSAMATIRWYKTLSVVSGVEMLDLRWEGLPETGPPLVNHPPVGGIALSLTDGRGYGALVWAVDPDGGLPTKVRMHIPSVVTSETFWNYYWADMPRYTGVNRHEAMVFLAQLPPGSHDACFDALDNQSGQWTRIGCRNHVVK